MFVKIEKKKNATYARIVQSYRDDNGKPKHKIIFNIGRIDDFIIDDLKKLSLSFAKLAGLNFDDISSKMICELKRLNYGFGYVIDNILDQIGLKDTLNSIASKSTIKVNLYKNCLLMIMERFRLPGSKLSNFNNQNKYLQFDENKIPLNHLYKTLDFLEKNQQVIKNTLFNFNYKNKKTKGFQVVFYDVTTFYFDSEKEKEDSIRQKGYSKDHKKTKTQIVFGLLINKSKEAIDYFIYEGNKYEGHTLQQVLISLQNKHNIKTPIIVTDSGMMNSENLNYLIKDNRNKYIIGERHKNLPNTIKEIYLNLNNYKDTVTIPQKNGKEEIMKYLVYDYEEESEEKGKKKIKASDKGKRLIFSYSSIRARKDKYEREKKIEKAKKLLENPSQINIKTSYYYIKKKNKIEYCLNEKLIEESSKYDGIHCVATNNKEINILEILDQYKHLYQIEHSFRTLKSYFELRPMFHWTNTRIKGHVNMLYICYNVLIYIQNKLKKELKEKISETELRNALNKMELSIVEQNKKTYSMFSSLNKSEEKILKLLDLNLLPKMIPEMKLKEYFKTI